MDITHQYYTRLRWLSDRKAELSSEELQESIIVATPPPFPKGTPGIWSPEHLLVASVSSCLMTTFLAIAENSNLEIASYEDQSIGTMENVDGKLAISEVILRPHVAVNSEAEVEKAERLLHKAESNCLISRSVKSRITLEPEIEVAAPAPA